MSGDGKECEKGAQQGCLLLGSRMMMRWRKANTGEDGDLDDYPIWIQNVLINGVRLMI